jgi:hypothetical protein
MSAKNSSKIRFGLLDAVVLIVAIALVGALVFRYTADKNLFAYNTEKYTVTVKACGLQYTTVNMIGSDEAVYLEDGKPIGSFVHAPTVTPMLSYSTTTSGDIIAAYYPDNTLVDIVTDIECDLIAKDGLIMTKSGVHIAVGAVIELHTETVDLTVEITSVEKNTSN